MTDPRQRPGPGRPAADELAALRRWLAAEAADASPEGVGEAAGEAEAALGALFAALPRPAPAPGLARRVLAAARPPRVVRPASSPTRVPAAVRRLVAASAAGREQLVPRLAAALLVAAGLAVSALAAVVGPLAGLVTPAAAIRGAAEAPFGLAAALGRWAGAALELLDTVFSLAGAVATAAASGPVAGSLTAALLVAALSFAVLHHVFETDRSLSHASHVPFR